jgi:hypothetical protein
MDTNYPGWSYFPQRDPAPQWVEPFVDVVSSARPAIDSARSERLTSDKVLAELRPGLEKLGFHVESGKAASEKIRRPVLFGEQGIAQVTYEVDAVHDELGILVEVEAGRGWMGNAVYRDLIRTSLIVDARYLALGVMNEYRYRSGGKVQRNRTYDDAKSLLQAIYASGRLQLPFAGVLLFGY